jgi:hypothetical protein
MRKSYGGTLPTLGLSWYIRYVECGAPFMKWDEKEFVFLLEQSKENRQF